MKIYKVFPNGANKVLTLSYDDGKHADRHLVSMLNKYGIKATFNLNPGMEGDENRIPMAEWPALYEGHEVACHTRTHPTIDRCPTLEVIDEVLSDKIALEQIFKRPIRGLAYPNGSYSTRIERILEDIGIKHARIVGDYYGEVMVAKQTKEASGFAVVGDTHGFAFPTNYLEWKATCHHNHNLLGFANDFVNLNKKQHLFLMYVWGHSYEFDRDNNWDMMEEFCKTVSNRSDIWYATNIEIVDYMEAFDRLQFSADLSFVYNPSVMSVWLLIDNKRVVEVPGGATVELSE